MEKVFIPRARDPFDKKITVYAFIMTIMVVLSHWTHFLPATNPGTDSRAVTMINNAYEVFGIFAMTSFFMFSGFLMYYGIESSRDLYGKICRRVLSLGVPFLFWNLFQLAYEIAYMVYKGTFTLSAFGIKNLILGFTLTPYNSPTWYMLALLMLMVLSPVFLFLKNQKGIAAYCFVAVFIISVVVSTLWRGEGIVYFWFRRLLTYVPLYFLGSWMGMHYSDHIVKEKYHARMAAPIAALAFAVIAVYLIFFKRDIQPVNVVLYQSLAPLAWIAIPQSLTNRIKIGFPITVYPFMYGMHSVLIIVLHWLTVRVIMVNHPLPMVADVFVQLLLVLIIYLISIFVSFIFKKILPNKVYRIFAGGSAGRKMF